MSRTTENEPTADPVEGTFTLSFDGRTTEPIPYDELPTPSTGVAATGGWCAPSETLYDLFRLPDIQISRGGSPYLDTPPVAKPAPTRRERFRAWRRYTRERLHAVRHAMRGAWRYPDGWWETEY